MELLVVAAVIVGMLGVFALTGVEAARRRRMAAIADTGLEPAEVKVPRGTHPPDAARARRALAEARPLLASAAGSLRNPLLPGENNKHDRTLDTDVLDAIQNARDALARLREAAERSPAVDAHFAARGFDPWTEPRCLDVVHVRLERAGSAFAQSRAFLEEALDVARSSPDPS